MKTTDKPRGKYPNKGLYSKILTMFIVVILLPAILLTWALMVAGNRESKSKAIEENGKNMSVAEGLLRSRFSSAESIALNFTLDQKVSRYFRMLYFRDDDMVLSDEEKRLEEELRSYTIDKINAAYSNQGVHISKCFFVFNSDVISTEYGMSNYLVSQEALIDKEEYQQFVKESQQYKTWLPISNELPYGYIIDSGIEPITTLTQKTLLIKMKLGTEFYGSIAITVPIKYLIEDIDKILSSVNADFALYDMEGNSIYGSADYKLNADLFREGAGTIDQKKSVVSYSPNEDTGTVTIISSKRTNSLTYLLAPVGILFGGIIFGVVYIIIKRVFRRIDDMMVLMDKAADGGLSERISVDDYYEIGKIASDFNTIMDKLDEQVQLTVEKETEQSRAMFLALQHQINPHFLFNMLEVFRNKFVLGGQFDVADSVSDFGKILRYNMKGGSIAPLRNEINMAEKFIALSKLKHGEENIRLTKILDNDVENYDIIKFVIQPVIENCLEHGKIDGQVLNITLKAQESDEHICIEISDDGKGFEPQAKKRFEDAFSKEGVPGESIGLLNVHRRLRLFYGDGCGVSIGDNDGRGSKIILKLKKQSPAGEQNV